MLHFLTALGHLSDQKDSFRKCEPCVQGLPLELKVMAHTGNTIAYNTVACRALPLPGTALAPTSQNKHLRVQSPSAPFH